MQWHITASFQQSCDMQEEEKMENKYGAWKEHPIIDVEVLVLYFEKC